MRKTLRHTEAERHRREPGKDRENRRQDHEKETKEAKAYRTQKKAEEVTEVRGWMEAG